MDYKSLGLRVGIEIHQRLDTKKLFCDCASQQQDEPVSIIKRKLRPSSGEMGKIDAAALHEFLRDRNFVYSLYPSETCLVESDEEPPHELNREALAISMQACKLLNCDIPEEIHVMRKTVIDGSNTTGFQRTAVIGLNGSIDGTKINSVCLEEEAARIEIREGETTYYKLNGLGIPLIEITTDSSINTPEEAKEIAEKIGFLLRSLKVQRGIGSIRKDVNISIRDGARNEIKGFQELKDIPKLIENEVARQLALIEIKNELHHRGAKLNIGQKDVTELFRKTKSQIIKKSEGSVTALHIPEFSGLLKKQCGDRTFAKELVGYIEPFGLKGFIHSDEDLEKYDLVNEFNELKKIFDAEERDIILIIAGENLDKVVDSLTSRIKEALNGVPEETIMADSLGSKYARPLPGAERMYPETDVPPIGTAELIKSVKIPITLSDKEKELKKILPEKIAEQLIKSK
ncbi:MAG TPA: Glu-tRNA(Gln) amidotransferase subunit GatE, partial [archaeon]|nr:Glu-tRNA(Gln) amidotransferase subunit GatE [archaeon]